MGDGDEDNDMEDVFAARLLLGEEEEEEEEEDEAGPGKNTDREDREAEFFRSQKSRAAEEERSLEDAEKSRLAGMSAEERTRVVAERTATEEHDRTKDRMLKKQIGGAMYKAAGVSVGRRGGRRGGRGGGRRGGRPGLAE